MPGVARQGRQERRLGAIHEVRARSAVHVQIDKARREIAFACVNHLGLDRNRHCLPHRRDLAPGDLKGAPLEHAIGQNEVAAEDEWLFRHVGRIIMRRL